MNFTNSSSGSPGSKRHFLRATRTSIARTLITFAHWIAGLAVAVAPWLEGENRQ